LKRWPCAIDADLPVETRLIKSISPLGKRRESCDTVPAPSIAFADLEGDSSPDRENWPLWLMFAFMFALYQDLSMRIDAIDFEKLKRGRINVERAKAIVFLPPLDQRSPAHRLDLVIIRIVTALHNDDMLDVPDRAGASIVQHTGAFSHGPMPAR
jgi:hypothetical protein